MPCYVLYYLAGMQTNRKVSNCVLSVTSSLSNDPRARSCAVLLPLSVLPSTHQRAGLSCVIAPRLTDGSGFNLKHLKCAGSVC
jgi:hypothetical protein